MLANFIHSVADENVGHMIAQPIVSSMAHIGLEQLPCLQGVSLNGDPWPCTESGTPPAVAGLFKTRGSSSSGGTYLFCPGYRVGQLKIMRLRAFEALLAICMHRLHGQSM